MVVVDVVVDLNAYPGTGRKSGESGTETAEGMSADKGFVFSDDCTVKRSFFDIRSQFKR